MDNPRLGKFPLKAGESTVRLTARPRLGVWHVLSYYQGGDGQWKIECRRAATGQVRYFTVDDLTYVRPSSKAGKAATHDRDCDRQVVAALVPAKPIRRKAPRKAVAR